MDGCVGVCCAGFLRVLHNEKMRDFPGKRPAQPGQTYAQRAREVEERAGGLQKVRVSSTSFWCQTCVSFEMNGQVHEGKRRCPGEKSK